MASRCLQEMRVEGNDALLARQLAVKARQADGEGLKSAHGIVVVQGEDVLGHSAKLHDDVVDCTENVQRVRL